MAELLGRWSVEGCEDKDEKLGGVGSSRERQANLPGRRDSEARGTGRQKRPRLASAREEAVQRYGRAREGEHPREMKTQERIGSCHPDNTGWLGSTDSRVAQTPEGELAASPHAPVDGRSSDRPEAGLHTASATRAITPPAPTGGPSDAHP